MADSRKFDSPKILQFGDRTSGNQPGDSGHCGQCEAMLADALDGTLSTADQQLFDLHMTHCGPCGQLLADARRGAAWLEMLRNPRPEPPAALLERILSQTSGAQMSSVVPGGEHRTGFSGATIAQPAGVGGMIEAPGYAPGMGEYANVVPFRRRVVAAVRANSFGQVLFQPRLAMTAAMAFFSIALTMNLTGVRLQDLRANDLSPSSLRRDFYSANARVVQYYEGLRVVYELESRVHDIQSASDGDGDTAGQSIPQNLPPGPAPGAQPGSNQPAGRSPAAQPKQPSQTSPAKPGPAGQPEQKPQAPPSGPQSRRAPDPGTSRRENLGRSFQLVAAIGCGQRLPGLCSPASAHSGVLVPGLGNIIANSNNAAVEGRLV